MPDKNGQSRLKRLFHRRDGTSSGSHQSTNSPPPASPTSPPSGQKLRSSSSRASLRDLARGFGRRSSQVSRPNTADASPGAQTAATTAASRSSQPNSPSRDGLSSKMGGLSVADGDDSNNVPQHLRQRSQSPPSLDNTAGNNFYDTHQYPRHLSKANGNQAQYPLPGGGATSPVGVRKMHPDDVFTHPRDAPAPPGSSAGNQGNARSPYEKPVLPEIPLVSSNEAYNFPTSKDSNAPATNHTRQTSSVYSKDVAPTSKPDMPLMVKKVREETVDEGVHSQLGPSKGYLVRDSTEPVDLNGIVDLKKTEDTTLHETWAPAVTHETIVENVHTIRQEVITREIHNHHYIHRVLPIVDIEVLPARHFLPTTDANSQPAYIEISPDEIPGRTDPNNAQWLIAETVSQHLPKNPLPRNFTARKFEGTEHDYREWTDDKGVKRSEQWWVHPPQLEEGGKRDGQTYEFHLGSPDPRDDGLRVKVPGGRVIGTSPLFAKQMRERDGKVQEGDVPPPPVPEHRELGGEKAFV